METSKCQQIKTLRLKIALLNANKDKLHPDVFYSKRIELRDELYTVLTRTLRRRCG